MVTRVVIGGLIAFALISFFVFGVDNPNPEWPDNWQIKPLILTPLAGMAGGLFFHFLEGWRSKSGWVGFASLLLSILGFLVALWMGTILGLNGTMWN